MPRYLVERAWPAPLALPGLHLASPDRSVFIQNNTRAGVIWICSYATLEGNTSFCIYDAPSPEAIRSAAAWNGLPTDRISEVQVLEP